MKQPAVLLSFMPGHSLLDVNILAKSCRQAQQEEDAGEGLIHCCLTSVLKNCRGFDSVYAAVFVSS